MVCNRLGQAPGKEGGHQMIWFKSCPRCKTGDLTPDGDDHRHCMQCGYTQYSSSEPAVEPELAWLLRAATNQRAAAVGAATLQFAGVG